MRPCRREINTRRISKMLSPTFVTESLVMYRVLEILTTDINQLQHSLPLSYLVDLGIRDIKTTDPAPFDKKQ